MSDSISRSCEVVCLTNFAYAFVSIRTSCRLLHITLCFKFITNFKLLPIIHVRILLLFDIVRMNGWDLTNSVIEMGIMMR